MEILKLSTNIKEIAQLSSKALEKGLILAVPTDTVYGFIANARNNQAVNRLFKIKDRSLQKPFPIFVRSIDSAKQIAQINPQQEEELRKSWPGKTTFILKKKGNNLFGTGEKTIALRIPNHPFLLVLLSKIDFPLIQTSANISQEKCCLSVEEIVSVFKDRKEKPDIIIDSGVISGKTPSKIIDITSGKSIILRQ